MSNREIFSHVDQPWPGVQDWWSWSRDEDIWSKRRRGGRQPISRSGSFKRCSQTIIIPWHITKLALCPCDNLLFMSINPLLTCFRRRLTAHCSCWCFCPWSLHFGNSHALRIAAKRPEVARLAWRPATRYATRYANDICSVQSFNSANAWPSQPGALTVEIIILRVQKNVIWSIFISIKTPFSDSLLKFIRESKAS